jgi:2-(1,2-epoxy-1,2-dihydrophenyl)acetyl-CoA isomerase
MDMEYQSIIYKKEDGVATVILNRPRALNALNEEMINEVLEAIKKCAADDEVKVLLLTGAGRAFCFGADPEEFHKAMEQPDRNSTEILLAKAQEIIRHLTQMAKPTIAALNGFATGLGLDLALACDLRIAAERAKLGEAFVSMGLVPDGGGTFFLPRLVGLAKAFEMVFFGDPITSADAERLGLLNRVVPNQDLEETSQGLAKRLAQGPSSAIRLAKRLLRENLSGDLDKALQREAESQKICLKSAEHQEAIQAFLEKRPPRFGWK